MLRVYITTRRITACGSIGRKGAPITHADHAAVQSLDHAILLDLVTMLPPSNPELHHGMMCAENLQTALCFTYETQQSNFRMPISR